MLRVGLTGGIACGKTTVAVMLRELGLPIIEADPLVHRLIEPGQPAYAEIVQAFGREVLAPDGHVDRVRLGKLIFDDAQRRERLNGIVHPRVIEEVERQFAALESNGAKLAVVEAALLVEAGYHHQLDRLVVVWCRPEQQLERLLARGLTRQQAEQRIAAQLPVDQKRRVADYVVDCSGALDETRRQVELVVASLEREATVRAGQRALGRQNAS